jgi:hypothetical protein
MLKNSEAMHAGPQLLAIDGEPQAHVGPADPSALA